MAKMVPGPGTFGQNSPRDQDHLLNFQRDHGPKQQGPGPGTRDHMTRCGWDQGPNQKNWLGPGTIGTPYAEPQDFLGMKTANCRKERVQK